MTTPTKITTLALAALLAGAAAAHGAGHEAVRPAFSQAIPNLPGKTPTSVIVDYPPGAKSLPHRHARSAFIYAFVVAGDIRSQVQGEPVHVFHAGDSWSEAPGAHHRISENASATRPARLLAVFVVDTADTGLTTPDAH